MTDFLGDWRAWREVREKRLRDPRGWLAITAIHWLDAAPQRFDDVPGEWCGHDHGATVRLDHEETLTTGGVLLTAGVHRLGPVDDQGLTVAFDDAVAEVADRDGATIVRPRHANSPNLAAYRGTPCYPPETRWVIPGRFEPYPASEEVTRETLDGEEATGEVVFEYGGAEHRLIALDVEGGALWVLFRDATSGVTTYPANRQMLIPTPATDGSVSIDFNRAYNMPCAYTDFATCPVPPAANTLPFAVEAGEQIPTMVPA